MSEHQHPASGADTFRPTGRRRLLQALALGGVSAAVLPEKWVKPVIDTVIVPAHAQATIVSITGIYSNVPQQDVMVPGGIFERLANFVVPSAHAQSTTAFTGGQCISFDCNDNSNVVVRYEYLPQAWAQAYSQVFGDNSLADVDVGDFRFTNLVATNSLLIGRVTMTNVFPQTFEDFALGRGGVCEHPI